MELLKTSNGTRTKLNIKSSHQNQISTFIIKEVIWADWGICFLGIPQH